ncbi:uncharacterized protein LOC106133670 [Amyelois transitella]|uniref:uncharacterized protein LOC106133670 n=1 Tax=Amyelois transitella TaxID=680683 RepID=UPI00298F7E37|nr:uncharacterized protein LOC106133670 [Amyelois transitella]
MDSILNSKVEKQTIYEIYRACRLCGGGAGYKMPIVQNVIDLDNNGVELKQKIQECLQIEVHQDDKMPPLICELCVDKVNDFYEFMEMCRHINKRTRLRLGLPLQAHKRIIMSTASSDSGDCILGVTEPIYAANDDDKPLSKKSSVKNKKLIKKEIEDDEPLSKSVKKNVSKKDIRVKKEPGVKVEEEHASAARKTRQAPSKQASASPRGRATRQSGSDDNTKLSIKRKSSDDNGRLSALKNNSKTSKNLSQPPVKGLQRELKELLDVKVLYKTEEESCRTKRSREKEPLSENKIEKYGVPAKKVKLSLPLKAPPKPKAKPKRPPSPPPQHVCAVCGAGSKSAQGLATHLRCHLVTFTPNKLSCNPCGEWFSTGEEGLSHHRRHKSKPYRCRHCGAIFTLLSEYDDHFETEDCKPFTEVPDKKCPECWRTYPTQLLLDSHRCQGPDGRPGGKCNKCNRTYTLLKNLKKHEVTCTVRKKGEAIVDPEVEKQLMDTQICLHRCDVLLTNVKGEGYDVSEVDPDFGFDPDRVYPYRYRIKTEPSTGYDTMVAIGDEVKEYYSRDYVHWDSDDSDTDAEERKTNIDSLTTITLKTIFSKKFLGKVPRRRRKSKMENDCNDFVMSRDINSIIDSLNKNDSANDSDCSESIFGPFKRNEAIDAENAFDSLLSENSQDTEKNFELCNSSEVKIRNTVSPEVNDSGLQINDSECVSCDDKLNESKESDHAVNETDDNILRNEESSSDGKLNDNSNEDNDHLMNETDKDFSSNVKLIDTTTGVNNARDTNDSTVNNNDTKERCDSKLGDVESQNHEVQKDEPMEEYQSENSQKESQSSQENERVDSDSQKDSNLQVEINEQSNAVNSAEVSENSDTKLNGQIDLHNLANETSDTEMDDMKLMDALDAQIAVNIGNGDKNNFEMSRNADNDTNRSNFKENFDLNDKDTDHNSKVSGNNDMVDRKQVSLNNIASERQKNLIGMNLDNISDEEFNFDT